ncbi:MAG: hypothetical protein HQ575_00515, partial [Candidatus Omnitrophica bacterium]|nr:hypothetical protein [Candidatus Omnitrophota bacterium]
KVGDEFQVRVIEVDPQGRINLSKKQVLGEYTGPREKPQRHEKRGRSDYKNKGRR